MTPHEWIERYGDAWRRADPEAAAALFTEDGIYRSHPLREAHVGHERIREYWRRATSTQSNLELRFGTPIVEGPRVAVEWWAQLADHGEPATLPGILLLRFAADGRCEELREAWHWHAGERIAPPPGWGV